jgi:hypothetical protein
MLTHIHTQLAMMVMQMILLAMTTISVPRIMMILLLDLKKNKEFHLLCLSSIAVNPAYRRIKIQLMEELVGRVVKVRANAIWKSRQSLKEMFDTPSKRFCI